MKTLFPYFGGKSKITDLIWARFGAPKQYIEPFFGSGAVLFAKPDPASLEVVGDSNGFLANFWRCAKYQPDAVAQWADYPISHIDLGARHIWLMAQRDRLGDALQDPNWIGDAQVAGWWLWGQCAWIGSGWCDWQRQIPHVGDAGQGVQARGQIPHVGDAEMLTTGGEATLVWMRQVARRLERCRIIHGDWTRCLNHHYGGKKTAIFFDPPYQKTENVYGTCAPVSAQVANWCREHADIKIALCGLAGEHDLPGWSEVTWARPNVRGAATRQETIWFSPACDNETELF